MFLVHSMVTANLNKSEDFVTNTTAAPKYIDTVNQNVISASKTVWHEIFLKHMIFAWHWTS